MYRIIFIIFVVFTSILINDTILTNQKSIDAFIDFHNQARKEVGVEPLEWSEELAKYALEWAKELQKRACELDHRPRKGKFKQLYGENIYWSWGRNEDDLINAAESWYEEKSKYKYGKLSYTNLNQTGHYTQMIWAKSKKVGAAIVKCEEGSLIIVANYDPRGNMIGEKPY